MWKCKPSSSSSRATSPNVQKAKKCKSIPRSMQITIPDPFRVSQWLGPHQGSSCRSNRTIRFPLRGYWQVHPRQACRPQGQWRSWNLHGWVTIRTEWMIVALTDHHRHDGCQICPRSQRWYDFPWFDGATDRGASVSFSIAHCLILAQHLNTENRVDVPLVLMTSFNTHDDTLRIIKKYANQQLRIVTFNQSRYPRIFKESLLPCPQSADDDKKQWCVFCLYMRNALLIWWQVPPWSWWFVQRHYPIWCARPAISRRERIPLRFQLW